MIRSFLFLSVTIALASPALAVVNGTKVNSKTVGLGGPQDYVVGLTITEKKGKETITSYCTGVFISPTTVLTAGHCAHKKPAVKFNGKSLEVKSVQLLSGFNYTGRSVSKDLAIVKLKKAPKSSFKVARIPDRNENLKTGLNLNIIGYGKTGLSSKTLLLDDMGILRQGISSAYFPFNNEILIDQSVGTGICQGDSGSPLLEENTQGFTVWGIAGTASSLSLQRYINQEKRKQAKEAQEKETANQDGPSPVDQPGAEQTQESPKKVMTSQDLTKFLSQNPHVDFCKGTGVYTDLRSELDWIKSVLAQP